MIYSPYLKRYGEIICTLKGSFYVSRTKMFSINSFVFLLFEQMLLANILIKFYHINTGKDKRTDSRNVQNLNPLTPF